MDIEAITAEMLRKPDAQYLLEWIDTQAMQVLAVDSTSAPAADIRSAIDAYFTGLEEQS